jgi:hypothetical protein
LRKFFNHLEKKKGVLSMKKALMAAFVVMAVFFSITSTGSAQSSISIKVMRDGEALETVTYGSERAAAFTIIDYLTSSKGRFFLVMEDGEPKEEKLTGTNKFKVLIINSVPREEGEMLAIALCPTDFEEVRDSNGNLCILPEQRDFLDENCEQFFIGRRVLTKLKEVLPELILVPRVQTSRLLYNSMREAFQNAVIEEK